MNKWIAICLLVLIVYISVSFELNSAWTGKEGIQTDHVTTAQYRWGDSPLDGNGFPVWAEDDTSKGWSETSTLYNPPNRQGRNYLWIRFKLPRAEGNQEIDGMTIQASQMFEVYYHHEKRYSFGNLRTGEYIGTPDRIVPLPDNSKGYMYLRIYSSSPNIGLFGDILLGSRDSIVTNLFKTEVIRLSLSLLYIIIGGISLYVYTRFRTQPYFFSFALFSICFGLYEISRLTIVYFFLDRPELWMYIELLSLYAGVASIVAFVEHLYGSGWMKLTRRLWQLNLVFGFVATILNVLQIVPVPKTLPLYQYFLIISIFIGFIHIWLNVRKEQEDAKLLLFGTFAFSATGLFDTIVNLWDKQINIPPLSYLGMLIMIYFIIVVLVRRLVSMFMQLKNSEKLSLAGQMAAGIAHEIRNPLTVLSGFLQLMKTDEKNKKNLNVMMSEIERINQIVTEFLVLSKPTSMHYEYHELKELLEEVLTLFQQQMEEMGIQTFLETEGHIPKVYCERNQLKQVLINLLKNAIEAMENGGIITISLIRYGKDRVRIHIRDEGDGISNEDLAKLGDPFFTTKEEGTGLGLMVSRKIIDQHGGSLNFFSHKGVGTTVRIELPNHSL